MAKASKQPRYSQYDKEFDILWPKLYDPDDGTCPVWAAIRSAAWRHRPKYIDRNDFERALIGRMYQKLKTNFKSKRRKGLSAEQWRATVAKLSQTAGAAAVEEVRKIIDGSRSKTKPKIYQLSDTDLLTAPEFDSGDSSDGDDSSNANSKASSHLKTETSHLGASSPHPMGDPLWFVFRLARGQYHSSGNVMVHLRECNDCHAALHALESKLCRFLDADKASIPPSSLSLLEALVGRRDPIEMLRWKRTHIESQLQQGRDIEINLERRRNIDNNLLLLGYSASTIEEKSSKVPGLPPKLMTVLLRIFSLIMFLDHHVEIFWDPELRIVNIVTLNDDHFDLLIDFWLSDPKEFVTMWHALR